MLALLSAWTGLVALLIALGMVVYRPLFHDVTIPLTLYTAITSLSFAGITLWALRKENALEKNVDAQRTQSFVGAGCALVAITIVYALIHFAQVVPRDGG